jgi:hypothetical protein
MSRNIDVHRDLRIVPKLTPRDGPAIGCTKIRRSASPARPRVDYTISTDHISPVAPGGFNRSFEVPRKELRDKGWVPKEARFTYSNTQSTAYDPITFASNSNPTAFQSYKVDARRTKGIAEYADLMRDQHPNFSAEFAAQLESNPKVYHRRTGIFTHMYDASARQGYITQPFERKPVIRGKV